MKLSKYLRKLSEDTDISIHGKLHGNPDDLADFDDFKFPFEIEPDRSMDRIYSALGNYTKIGRHRDTPDSDYDPVELKKGIRIEHEHTNSKAIAKEIAKDHLAEIKDYYTRLERMEREAKEK